MNGYLYIYSDLYTHDLIYLSSMYYNIINVQFELVRSIKCIKKYYNTKEGNDTLASLYIVKAHMDNLIRFLHIEIDYTPKIDR